MLVSSFWVAECSKYVDLLSSKGVTVIFEKENIRSDDKSLSVVLKILATLAQQESNSISQAQRWAYTQNAKMGKPTRVAVVRFSRGFFVALFNGYFYSITQSRFFIAKLSQSRTYIVFESRFFPMSNCITWSKRWYLGTKKLLII